MLSVETTKAHAFIAHHLFRSICELRGSAKHMKRMACQACDIRRTFDVRPSTHHRISQRTQEIRLKIAQQLRNQMETDHLHSTLMTFMMSEIKPAATKEPMVAEKYYTSIFDDAMHPSEIYDPPSKFEPKFA